MAGVTIRSARLEDVAVPARWAEELGWALSNDEELLKALYLAYGAIAAECEGEVVGYAGAYEVSEKEGVLVTLIVKENMQGRGIGRLLMTETKKRLAGRNIIIRSTNDGFYIKDGWHCVPVKWEVVKGDINRHGPDPARAGTTFLRDEIAISDFVNYECRTAGYNAKRQIFIEEIAKSGHRYAAMLKGHVTGVLLGRIVPGNPIRWWKIQTLMADDPETAISLLSFAMKDLPGDCKVMLAVPQPDDENYNQLKKAFNLTLIYGGSTFCDNPVSFRNVYSCTPF